MALVNTRGTLAFFQSTPAPLGVVTIHAWVYCLMLPSVALVACRVRPQGDGAAESGRHNKDHRKKADCIGVPVDPPPPWRTLVHGDGNTVAWVPPAAPTIPCCPSPAPVSHRGST